MLSDNGDTLTAWKGTSSSLTSFLSASDSTYSAGYPGIEASGNISLSLDFRASSFSKAKLMALPIRDDLHRSENPLSNGGKWSKTLAAEKIGGVWNNPEWWLGYGSWAGTFSSAYWNSETFSDPNNGVGVAATMTVPPGNGEWMAVYLHGTNLDQTSQTKYEARWLGTETAGTYTLEITKVTSSTRTVLVSRSATLEKGSMIALTAKQGGLRLWAGKPPNPAPMLSANESSLTSGYAGISAYGAMPTADNFRAGYLILDPTPPAAPTVSGVSPSSPANNNSPKVTGSAEAGSTVRLYTNSTCTGAAAATGTAAAFTSPGIAATVADNTTTTFYATATDAAANVSPCSSTSVTYTEDSTPPAVPTVSSTNPVSGSNNNSPKVIGSAEAGATVKLYTTSNCTGTVAATGTAAAFASPGLAVSVADNTTTTFRANAVDAAGNASACSSTSVTYVEGTPKIYWGAWLGGNAYSTKEKTYGDGPWDSGTWNLFEEHAGRKVSIVHFGQPAPWNQAFAEGPLKLTRERGAIPLMDMDPDGVTLKEIARGEKDADFETWAKAVKGYGYPLFFRWAWEMNGTWFQWGEEAAENPTMYKEAWWHLHDLFEEQGAENITWVWCPNLTFSGSTSLASLYPGDEYVDWTCLDGYNHGTNPAQPDSWKSFSTLYTSSYNELLSLAPSKPIMIGEMASTEYGGEKSAWITDAIGTQIPKNFPKIKAVVWFNKWDGAKDWPIETSASAQTAFKNAIAAPIYAGNTFGSLPTLTKIQPLP
jgi:glycosyl hydrolase family 26